MGKKTHSVEESDRTISPANARPALFGSGDKVFDALAILRGVRTPGKNKLTLREAIAVSHEQGEAFARWQVRNTPIRRIQVWVEGNLFMTNSLDDGSINLKSLDFNVESPRDAVMQILKADKDEEPVVLRNFPLGTVGRNGLVDVTPLPNGQLRLQIAPPKNGRFSVKVELAEGKDVSLPSAGELLPKDDVNVVSRKRRSDRRSLFSPWLWQPLTNARSLVLFGIVFVSLGLAAFSTLKWQAAMDYKPLTASQSSIPEPTPKRKPNNRPRINGGSAGSKGTQKHCCDQEGAEQDPQPESQLTVARADSDPAVSTLEERPVPESQDNKPDRFAPPPNQAQHALTQMPTIKIGERLAADGPTPFVNPSNRFAGGSRESSQLDRGYAQRTRSGFDRQQPE